MKIVFLDASTVVLDNDISMSALEELGDYQGYDTTEPDDLVERAQDAEVIITNKVRISESSLERLPSLRHIAVSATGYDNVDIAAATRRGITVSNVPGYSTDSVAQQVFAAILQHATHLRDYAADVQDGDWQRSTTFTILRYPCFELQAKKLGIIGFGEIGRAVGEIGRAFGMQVLPYRRGEISDPNYNRVELEELIRESDVISVHCPLTPETRNLIDAEVLSQMKSSAFLVNTARGGIVNEADLARALRDGTIAGAAVDVLSSEPPRENPLMEDGIPNLIVTPHTAWAAREARERLMAGVAASVKAFLNGERYNVVN